MYQFSVRWIVTAGGEQFGKYVCLMFKETGYGTLCDSTPNSVFQITKCDHQWFMYDSIFWSILDNHHNVFVCLSRLATHHIFLSMRLQDTYSIVSYLYEDLSSVLIICLKLTGEDLGGIKGPNLFTLKFNESSVRSVRISLSENVNIQSLKRIDNEY